MKILVCGDSWAADHNNENSWTKHLAKMLNCQIDSYAQHGCSNYLILQQFLNNYKKNYDVVITIKTSPRIPFVKGHPHLCSYKSNSTKLKLPAALKTALDFYYMFFWDKDLLDLISETCFEKIENNRLQNQKIIWVSAFPDTINQKEIENLSVKIEGNLFEIYNEDEDLINHLSIENNYNLAIFFKNLLTDSNANKDLSKHTWNR